MKYAWHTGLQDVEVIEAGTGRVVFTLQVPRSFTRWWTIRALKQGFARRLAGIKAGYNIWVGGEWCYREVPGEQ